MQMWSDDLQIIFVVYVQSTVSTFGAGKKKCTENVSVIIPDIIDDEPSDTVIAADDIASVHTSGVHCAVDASSVTPEV